MTWGNDMVRRGATHEFTYGKTREQTEMLMMKVRRNPCIGAVLALLMTAAPSRAADDPTKDKAASAMAKAPLAVSFDRQIRPILQVRCQGCHQPAKAGGGYVMTSFDRMLRGGESDLPAIVPSQPGESHLVEMITPENGKAEMPQDKPALSAGEIELITRWIAQGAKDDTPQTAVTRYDMGHPPEYTRLPVVPALAFSPDGALLAVAGFHEVLLWKSDGTELVGRLVGLSQRIESLSFSPDGKKLAVSAGRPARMGEVQIWDVAAQAGAFRSRHVRHGLRHKLVA